MDYKSVIITGANSGLGFECVRAIISSNQPWHIIMACRDVSKAEKAKRLLVDEFNYQAISILKLDLASLHGIQNFVDTVKNGDYAPLGGIICNAGIQISKGQELSNDGFELTFAVNHLGHFALVNSLVNSMEVNSRIIVVSSGTHNPATFEGRIEPANYLGAENLAYVKTSSGLTGMQRYTTSKLCNIMYAYELDRRLKRESIDISINAFDPGGVPQTNLLRGEISAFMRFLKWLMNYRFIRSIFGAMRVVISTPQISGSAMAELLLKPELKNISGKYFQLSKQIDSSEDSYSKEKALNLWCKSLKLVEDKIDDTQQWL